LHHNACFHLAHDKINGSEHCLQCGTHCAFNVLCAGFEQHRVFALHRVHHTAHSVWMMSKTRNVNWFVHPPGSRGASPLRSSLRIVAQLMSPSLFPRTSQVKDSTTILFAGKKTELSSGKSSFTHKKRSCRDCTRSKSRSSICFVIQRTGAGYAPNKLSM